MASHDEGGIAVADSRGALLQPIICGSGAPRYVLCMLPNLDLLSLVLAICIKLHVYKK